jgi:hypothetical protein
MLDAVKVVRWGGRGGEVSREFSERPLGLVSYARESAENESDLSRRAFCDQALVTACSSRLCLDPFGKGRKSSISVFPSYSFLSQPEPDLQD